MLLVQLGQKSPILGYVDSDFAKDIDRGRSILGYAFIVMGCIVIWEASLQHIVTLSTTEAEFVALTEVVKEALWMKGFVYEMGVKVDRAVVLCDQEIEVRSVNTLGNAADMLTKALPGLNFGYCLEKLNLG
ncbi:hypothetical protein L1987_49087 [Smallanthus sonchifolius]|uniref:Uncharacterized protein n=1 Tax=Smallanthus sonchifolius TaxID=185202 RepID=A0ACB9FTR4_9ASTR|nr:hypothetical protein L1987_49087 [Smallanthus sonchifolius]